MIKQNMLYSINPAITPKKGMNLNTHLTPLWALVYKQNGDSELNTGN